MKKADGSQHAFELPAGRNACATRKKADGSQHAFELPAGRNACATRKKADWFQSAFTSDYLKRYPHRSDAAAREEIRFVAKALGLPPGARVLDLCCGAGRHSRALRKSGLDVVGLDLSLDLLREALKQSAGARRSVLDDEGLTDLSGQRRPDYQVKYVRGDMRRIPFRADVFDGAVNLFTSFGYFATDRENAAVLRGVNRVLKRNAPFVLDFMNITATLRDLVPESIRTVGRTKLRERRFYDKRSRRIVKDVSAIRDSEKCVLRESIRAYSPMELAKMLRDAGFRVARRFGDLDGARFRGKFSPRCVLLSYKR